MARRARLWGWLWMTAWLVSSAATATAQQKKDDEFSLDEEGDTQADAIAKQPQEGVASGEESDQEAELLSDEQALEEERNPQEQFRKSTDPYEDPEKNYFFAGVNWRYLRMPPWLLELGLESAPGIGSAGSFFGEFGWRNDGFQIGADVGWMKYHMKGPFQLSGDPPQDTEWMEGPFNLFVVTATFTWSTSFTDWMSLDYGVEAGFLLLFGELTRSEAYKGSDGEWHPCPSWVGSSLLPNATDAGQIGYCSPPLTEDGSAPSRDFLTNEEGEDGEHYGVKANRGLFNQGVPNALPVIGPRISLRFKPIAQLVLRVDVPLPVFPFGFTGGLAALFGF
jgi:hypothetical protein